MNQILQREIRLFLYNAYNTLFRLLEERAPELDIDQLLENEKLSRAQVNDLYRPLDCIPLYKLSHQIEEQEILPGASLLWALHMDMYGNGLLSYAMATSRTYGQMLTAMEHISISSFSELGKTRTVIKGDTAYVKIEIPPAIATYRREYVHDWFATLARFVRAFLPQVEGRFSNLRFQHEKPGYASLYEEIFKCAATFNQPEDAIYFPKEWLDLPLVRESHGTSDITSLMSSQAAEAIGHQEGFIEQVSQYLLKNPDLPSIRIEDIAAAFNMTTSSFRRKLSQEGSTYKKLLADIRLLIARNYLKNTSSSIQEIAYMIGYQQTCSFHRAFKEQYGITPKEYREQN